MIKIKINTFAEHPTKYQHLCDAWKPYRLEEFAEGDFIPAHSEYLDSYVDTRTAVKTRKFAFKTHIPKPRKLCRLDQLFKTMLDLEVNATSHENSIALTSSLEKVVENVKNELFESDLEKDWWESHREVVFVTEAENVTVEINSKSE